MGDGADVDTEQVEVRTRVPAYQKDEWVADAERLEMSQTEFVRTMVQAGRRELGLQQEPAVEPSMDRDPRGRGMEDRVLAALQDGPASWDELLDAVTDDIEAQLDEAVAQLQADGQVRHSGRDGGYVLTDE